MKELERVIILQITEHVKVLDEDAKTYLEHRHEHEPHTVQLAKQTFKNADVLEIGSKVFVRDLDERGEGNVNGE